MKAQPSHIVFDLDGTLVDSVHDLAAAASELVTTLGGRSLAVDEVALMVGDGAGVLVRRALEAAGLDPRTPDALQRFLEIYDRRLLETTRPYPGTEAMLRAAAARAQLSVVTNKPQSHSERILDALGLLGFFDRVIGGDSPFGRKPDPAGVRAVAPVPERAALVGDSPVDWATAGAAGCPFVWARYGFGALRFTAPPGTPYMLERPEDLSSLLDAIG